MATFGIKILQQPLSSILKAFREHFKRVLHQEHKLIDSITIIITITIVMSQYCSCVSYQKSSFCFSDPEESWDLDSITPFDGDNCRSFFKFLIPFYLFNTFVESGSRSSSKRTKVFWRQWKFTVVFEYKPR